MSSSTPKFLLDENVRIELNEFLEAAGLDAKRLPKTSADSTLAAFSKSEERIIVTNDKDFSSLPEDKIFAAVWLRIPQKDVNVLLLSFRKLLAECSDFKGKLIILKSHEWKVSSLGEPLSD